MVIVLCLHIILKIIEKYNKFACNWTFMRTNFIKIKLSVIFGLISYILQSFKLESKIYVESLEIFLPIFSFKCV